MSWLFDPSSWVDGVTVPFVKDYQNIAADIHRQGANADGAGYGRSNAGFITLKPGELPGAVYGVTGASWANGVATLTIGAHDITAGQHVAVSGVTPSGYNIADAPITAIGASTISYAVVNNPGAWTSGGTVTVGTSPPAAGMLVASPALPASLYFYDGTKWVPIGSGAVGATSANQLGNINASGYGSYSQSFLGFRPGELPGAQYNVQAASWAGNVATLTIPANNIQVGQHISLSGANPVGWNVPDAVVTNATGTTIQFSMSTNPGAWTGGGTVGVDLLSGPSTGMMAVNPAGQLVYYNGSSWTQPGAGMTDPTTARGDLIVRPATGAPTRLPIGATNGLVLTVDSTAALNMSWKVINTSSLGAVPTSTQVIAGSGMTGGGALTGNVTLNANVTSVFGRTGAVVLTNSDITGAGGVSNATQIIAGPGLSGGGQLTGNVTLSAAVVSVFGRTGAVTLTPADLANAGGVASTRKILTGYGLTGGGDLTADRTIAAVDDSTLQKTAFLYKGNNVSQRSYLNFINSGNVTVSVNDNPTSNRVDVTIGTASAATTTVSHNGNLIGTEPILNFIDTATARLSVGDDGTAINVSITAVGGGSGGSGSQTPWLSDIDASSYRLTNLTSINGPASALAKLGIGTDAPTSVLEVASAHPSGRANITFSNPGAENVANRVRLRMGPSASFVGTDNQPYMEGMNLDATGVSGLGFGTYASPNQYENMRLVPYANGQVYIGTTTPLSAGGLVANGNERLHVSGQAIIGNTPVSSSAVLPGSQPLLVLSDANNPTAYLSVQQLSSSGSHSAAIQMYANGYAWRIANKGNLDSTTAPLVNRLAVVAGANEVLSIYTTGLVLAANLQLSSGLQFTSGGITFADSSFQATAFPGAAGSQTPWVTDIDGAGHKLTNAGAVNIGTGLSSFASFPFIVHSPTAAVLASVGYGVQAGVQAYRIDGTPTAPTALLAGDWIGQFSMHGYNGSATTGRRASFMGYAAEAWTATANGTYVIFETTPLGSVAPAERLRIDPAGNVGIGTSTPLATLHVRAGTDQDLQIGSMNWTGVTGSVGLNAVNDANSGAIPMVFGATKFIFQGGNVGIGTSTPSAALSVFGNNGIYGGSAIFCLNSSAAALMIGHSGTYPELQAVASPGSASVSNLLLNPNGGNVGIGTTAPLRKLHVASVPVGGGATITGSAPSLSLSNADSEPNANTMEVVLALATAAGNYQVSAGDSILFNNGSARGNIRIESNYGGGGTTNVVMQAGGGNVGIGTTAPANLLHLVGNSATPSLRLGATSLPYYWDIGRENATTGDFVFNCANGAAPAEQMRITTGGNVGIGINAPTSLLHIMRSQGATTWLTIDNPNGASGVGQGIKFAYGATGGAGGLASIQNVYTAANNWQLMFSTWNNSAATLAMTIDTHQNVGIGTGRPDVEATNARLAIVGLAGQRATSLATSNTQAVASFRPDLNSGYTLAIGMENSTGSPYLQGVNYNGGAAGAHVLLQPWGGRVGIGTSSILPYATLTSMAPAVTSPSLTAQSIAAATFGTLNVTELAVFADGNGWGYLQMRHCNANGYSYPLFLNGLGGSVSVGTNTNTGDPLTVSGPAGSMIRLLPQGNSYGTLLYQDTGNFYILLTNPGASTGSFNGLRPFYISLGSGLVNIGNGLNVAAGGLTVAGNVNITGQYQVNGVPINTTGGVTTWASYNSAQRAQGTTYQNTTGKPMFVSVYASYGGGQGITAKCDSGNPPGTIVSSCSNSTSGGFTGSVAFWVLPNFYYSLSGGYTLQSWIEWN